MQTSTLDVYLRRWKLVADGGPMRGGRLLPVLRDGEPAMLKIVADDGERLAGATLESWDGDGAARLLVRDGRALLVERAVAGRSLADMSRDGRDDEVCRILCGVASRLHAPGRFPAPSGAPVLADWFRSLEIAAQAHGGILARCDAASRDLLRSPGPIGFLHGDLHHGNVLDFGVRGWLAIDPKGVVGELAFDFANLFLNPDLDDPARPVASMPGVLARRVGIVADATGFDRTRLLICAFAWAGLAASWYLQDRDPRASAALGMAEIAGAELGF